MPVDRFGVRRKNSEYAVIVLKLKAQLRSSIFLSEPSGCMCYTFPGSAHFTLSGFELPY